MCTMNSRCIYHTKKEKKHESFPHAEEKWDPDESQMGKKEKKQSHVGFFTLSKASNQWRGSFQGADEEYLCVIIMAQKLMLGGGVEKSRQGVIKFGRTETFG